MQVFNSDINNHNGAKVVTTIKNLLYLLLFQLFIFLLLACTANKDEGAPTIDDPLIDEKEYTLVWAEEFDIDGPPNPDNWSFEEGFVRNQELQWYQKQNAFVENGLLVIEGRRDTFPNPQYDPENGHWRNRREFVHYSSSSIRTDGNHAWRYGIFEIRAKIITEPGLWPAIWTVGEGHEWPQGGEIDIMEFYKGQILANAAWAGTQRWQAVWDSYKLPVSELGEGWSDEFHIWKMEWTHDFIKIYVDDRLLNTVPLGGTINKRGTIVNPFRETQQVLILNLAIGGQSGGDPSNTEFPSRYEVDYVRVYQLQ
jgi:beta-glucanase (GH16 family)